MESLVYETNMYKIADKQVFKFVVLNLASNKLLLLSTFAVDSNPLFKKFITLISFHEKIKEEFV